MSELQGLTHEALWLLLVMCLANCIATVYVYTIIFEDYIILQLSSDYISSTPIQKQATTYCETNFVLAIFSIFNAVLRIQYFMTSIRTSVRSLIGYTITLLLLNWKNGFDSWTGRWRWNCLDVSLQRVTTNNSMFKWKSVNSSLLQASILGPILLNIFINDTYSACSESFQVTPSWVMLMY